MAQRTYLPPPFVRLGLIDDSTADQAEDILEMSTIFDGMISGGVTPLFELNYATGVSLGVGSTFTRTTSATFEDFEPIIKTVPTGAARIQGARVVENLLAGPTDDLATETVTVVSGDEYRMSCDQGAKVVLTDGTTVEVISQTQDYFSMDFTMGALETLTLPVSGTINCLVDWGDGSAVETFTASPMTHTYTDAGTYTVVIDGELTGFAFNATGDRLKLVDVNNIGTTQLSDFDRIFYGCTNLLTISDDGSGVFDGTNFSNICRSCSSLTSFPLVDVSSGTNFTSSWINCSSLTSFPALDVSSGTNFFGAWEQCSGLTSFPLLDVSSGTSFAYSWRLCSSLTSFPALDVSGGTTFASCWQTCSSMTSFPANMFDSSTATDFSGAFTGCALDQTSVDNILVSIDTAGQSTGTLNMTGGTSSTPSATGLAAKTSLEGKGWTVTVN